MVKKAEAIDVYWYLEEKLPMRFDDGLCECRLYGRNREDLLHQAYSLMPMLPSESSICHTNLGTTIHSCMFHILEWLLINACNNEDYAKIWTRPHLDTLYFAHDAYRVSPSPF